jgi:hypothetical protein
MAREFIAQGRGFEDSATENPWCIEAKDHIDVGH